METRTFKGILDWRDNPVWTDHKWEFVFVFSEDLKMIVDGHVRYVRADGHQNAKGHYNQGATRYVMLKKDFEQED